MLLHKYNIISSDNAYFKYLHKAISLKKAHPNESIMNVCHDAIHDKDVIQIYQSANIELNKLRADIEDVMKLKSPSTNLSDKAALNKNRKHELILKCDVEISFMMHELIWEEKKFKTMARLSKAHHDAYNAYLRKANKVKQEQPELSMRAACEQAIDHNDLEKAWKDAEVDVNGLLVNIESIEKAMKHKSDKDLNQKEKLVVICEYELSEMTKAVEREIEAVHNKL